jgi:hypothetical protein
MILTAKIRTFYQSVKVRAAEAIRKNADVLDAVNHNLPAFLTVAAVLTAKMSFPVLFGICWEKDLRDDVASLARERILKELTSLDIFSEIIGEVEPALRDSIGRAMAEISRLESSYRFNRTEFGKQQEAIIEMIVKDVWQALEPKIQDEQKKARIKAWIDDLQGRLKSVDEVQQRAAEVLRESVREILLDFNGKCEDQLGQSIPGEIEGEGADRAMHELAETIVEKIMDRELDFEVAMGQVTAEIKKSEILDVEGREKLITDLLKQSRTNDGGTGLEQLFADFRKTYLDPGPGTLGLPKKTDMKALDRTQKAGHADSRTKKGGKTDAESN